MAAKKSGYEAVRSGVDPRKDGTGGGKNWLKIESGEAVDVVCLVSTDDILAVEQCAIWLEDGENSPVWVYTGPEDPSHDLKVDRTYRAYLPVLVDGEPKVWSMSKTSHKMLLDIADAGGELKGSLLRIKRTGSGKATRYSIVPRGKRKDVSSVEEVDVISMLGPITSEEVREMLVTRFNKEDYEELVESYTGKKAAKSKAAAKVKVDDDDDLEDLDETELI
jgi:hypothetical protein